MSGATIGIAVPSINQLNKSAIVTNIIKALFKHPLRVKQHG